MKIGKATLGMYACSNDSRLARTAMLALELIEKETPKKAIITEKSSQACPVCESNVSWKYCPNCGQKISY